MSHLYFQHRPRHLEQPRYFPPQPRPHTHPHPHPNPHPHPHPNPSPRPNPHHHHHIPNHILPRPVRVDRDVYPSIHFKPSHLPPPPRPLPRPPPRTLARPTSTPSEPPYRSTPYQPQLTFRNRSNGLRQTQHLPLSGYSPISGQSSRPFIDEDDPHLFLHPSDDLCRVRPGGGPIPTVFNRDLHPVGRNKAPLCDSDEPFRGLNVEMDDYGRSKYRCTDQVVRSGNHGFESFNSLQSIRGNGDNFDPEDSFISANKMLKCDTLDRFNGNVNRSCTRKILSGFHGEKDDDYGFSEVFTPNKRKQHSQESDGYDTTSECREKAFNCFRSPIQSMKNKKSALLRLKVPDVDTLANDDIENGSNDCHISRMKRIDSSGSFSGNSLKRGNVSDLDVSIKSNVLVAKANVCNTDFLTELMNTESPRRSSEISPIVSMSKRAKPNVQIDSPVYTVSGTVISTQCVVPSESEALILRVQSDEMNSSYGDRICEKNYVKILHEECESSHVKGTNESCQKAGNSVNTAVIVDFHRMAFPLKKQENRGISMPLRKSQEIVNANSSSHLCFETSADCIQINQTGESFDSILGSKVAEKTMDINVKGVDMIFDNPKETQNCLQGSVNGGGHEGCGIYSNKFYESDHVMQPEVISPLSLGGLYSNFETNCESVHGMDSINIINMESSDKKSVSNEFKDVISTKVSKSSAVLSCDSPSHSQHESPVATVKFLDGAGSMILSNGAHSRFDTSKNDISCIKPNLCFDELPLKSYNNLELGNFQPRYSNTTVEINEIENHIDIHEACFSKDHDDFLIQPLSDNGTSFLCGNSSGGKNMEKDISKPDVHGKSNSRTPRKKAKKRLANKPALSSSLQTFNMESNSALETVNRDPVLPISPEGLTEKCDQFSVPSAEKLCTTIPETGKTAFREKQPIKIPILDVNLPIFTSDQDSSILDTCFTVDSNILKPEDIQSITQMNSRADGESVVFLKDDAPSTISSDQKVVGEHGCDIEPMPNNTPEKNIGQERKPVDNTDIECKSFKSFVAASDPRNGFPILSPDEKKQIQGSRSNDATDNPTDKKMDHMSSALPRVVRDNLVSGNFSTKRRLPSGNNGRRHTWHRVVNPSAISKKSNPDISSLQNLQPLISKSQCSYIHKGNSIVRKIVPVMPLPKSYSAQSCSASDSENYIRDDTGPDCNVETTNMDTATMSKEVDAISGRHNIFPVVAADSTFPLKDYILEDDTNTSTLSEAVAMISEDTNTIKVSEAIATTSEDSPKFPLLADDQLKQNKEMGGGNMGFPDKEKLIYGKCQPNQLVIASNPSECYNNNAYENNTVVLDGYYKRRKNQLIRSADNIAETTLSGDSSNSDDQMESKYFMGESPQKKHSSRIMARRNKFPNSFRLWTYNRAKTRPKDGFSLKCQAMLSYLFPWKRTYFRKSMHNSVSRSSSLCTISRKLLLTRKRKTIYTKSSDGFSLRRSKVLSIGGSNLKWSKSIERRSRKANECATQAIAEVERTKRQQKSCPHPTYKKQGKNYLSMKSLPYRGERIFRIGSLRYKMDTSGRTLQWVEDSSRLSAGQAALQAEAQKVYVPKRLHIGDDEYVRIGNGNQLVRDPKKRARVMAKEKIRWSLHTVRLRVAKKHTYCQFYTRFGKCEKESGKCPYIHDPSKIAVCTKFLRGSCLGTNCNLTHKVMPERMQECSYFLRGICSNSICPYRHVNVNPGAPTCDGFLRGYCADGDECVKKHNYHCPSFEALGICPQGTKCKLQHRKKTPTKRKNKRIRSEQSNCGRRYFGPNFSRQKPAQTTVFTGGSSSAQRDVFFQNGKLVDYISLDVSDGVVSDDAAENVCAEKHVFDEEDIRGGNLDGLIMPLGIMNGTFSN